VESVQTEEEILNRFGGQRGTIVLATNVAGRGKDFKTAEGRRSSHLLKNSLGSKDPNFAVEFKKAWDRLKDPD